MAQGQIMLRDVTWFLVMTTHFALREGCDFIDNCEVCENPEVECLDCEAGHVLTADNFRCLPCEENCESCIEVNGKSRCQKCYGNFYLGDNFLCARCPSHCTTCSGANTCQQCDNGFFLSRSFVKCQACFNNCAECREDGTCLACNDGDDSKDGYFLSGNNCIKCPDVCVECSSFGTCKRCRYGNWWDATINACVACIDLCEACDTSVGCVRCEDGFTLNENATKCVSCAHCSQPCPVRSNGCDSCKDGFFSNDVHECQACEIHCEACNMTSCRSCDYGFYPNGTVCLPCNTLDASTCSSCKLLDRGQYHDGISCVACDEHCKQCTGALCFSCDDGFHPVGRSCKACYSSCQTCSGSGSQACLVCAPGHYLTGIAPGSCQACHSSCSSCSGPMENECTECHSGSHLRVIDPPSGICSPCSEHGSDLNDEEACPQCSLVPSYYRRGCLECRVANCESCSDNRERCLWCNNGYYLQQGACRPCVSLPSENSCVDRPECGWDGYKCKDCTITTNRPDCMDEINCGWNIEQSNCQACVMAKNRTSCSTILGCFWDTIQLTCTACNSADISRCTRPDARTKCQWMEDNCADCTITTNRPDCMDEINCGWNIEQSNCQACVMAKNRTSCSTILGCFWDTIQLTCTACNSADISRCTRPDARTKCQWMEDNCAGTCNVQSDPFFCPQSVECGTTGNECIPCQSLSIPRCDSSVGCFWNSISGECSGCPKNCAKCVNQAECSQCSEGAYLNGTTCLRCEDAGSCSGPGFENCVNQSGCKAICAQYSTREACETSANGCTYFGNVCWSCSSLPKGSCIARSCGWKTPDNTCHACQQINAPPDCKLQGCFWNGTSCLSCPDNLCSECSQDNGQCTECSPGFGLTSFRICSSSCPAITDQQECEKVSICDYHGGFCHYSCRSAEYWDINSSRCSACTGLDPQCIRCTSQGCTMCRDLYMPINGTCTVCPLSLGEQDCVNACTINTSPLWRTPCEACPRECAACTSGSTKNNAFVTVTCTDCIRGFYLQNGACLSITCGSIATEAECEACDRNRTDSKFQWIAGVCIKCPPHCSQCDASGDCVVGGCNAGYITQAGRCNSCTMDEHQCKHCTTAIRGNYYDMKNSICQACGSSCIACKDSNNCIKCAEGHYLSAGRCFPCQNACLQCSGASDCIDCGPSKFWDQINKICKACPTNCLDCASINTCNKCSDSKYFNSTLNMCTDCPNFCMLCDTNKGCTRCLRGYYLQGNKCSECDEQFSGCQECSSSSTCDDCGSGKFLKGRICAGCGTGCHKCINETKCNDCLPSYCLDDYGVCHYTNEACATCDANGAEISCTSCASGRFLNFCTACADANCMDCSQSPYTCVQCLPGHYKDPQDGKCKRCDSVISGCKGCITSNACTDCGDHSYLHRDSASGISACRDCGFECERCQNSTVCLECAGGYHLVKDDLNPGRIVCRACGINCAHCNNGITSLNKSPPSCISCSDGFFKDKNGTCAGCSDTYEKCSKCEDKNKDEAIADGECLSCENGYLKEGQGPCQECRIAGCRKCSDRPHVCNNCSAGYIPSGDRHGCHRGCYTCSGKQCPEDIVGNATIPMTPCTHWGEAQHCEVNVAIQNGTREYKRGCSTEPCTDTTKDEFCFTTANKMKCSRCCDGHLCNTFALRSTSTIKFSNFTPFPITALILISLNTWL